MSKCYILHLLKKVVSSITSKLYSLVKPLLVDECIQSNVLNGWGKGESVFGVDGGK